MNSAKKTTANLIKLCSNLSGIQLLYELKFNPNGRDPIEDRNLNLIKQLNQLFTYFASVHAVKFLLDKHPQHAPYIMNLGTSSGYDIISNGGIVVGEVFSSANPKNNNKLEEDLKRLSKIDNAKYKYAFYSSPIRYAGEKRLKEKYEGVNIVYFDIRAYLELNNLD
jgi:hypothetical protein